MQILAQLAPECESIIASQNSHGEFGEYDDFSDELDYTKLAEFSRAYNEAVWQLVGITRDVENKEKYLDYYDKLFNEFFSINNKIESLVSTKICKI